MAKSDAESAMSLEEQAEQIKRITKHAFKGLYYLRILESCFSTLSSADCFTLCCEAVQNDLVSKLCLLLDKQKDAKSFWFFYNTMRNNVEEIMPRKGDKHKAMLKLADRVWPLRNETHFHLDGKHALDFNAPWRQAGLNPNEIREALDLIIIVCNHLLVEIGEDRIKFPDYTGGDFRQLLLLGADHGVLHYDLPEQWRTEK
jgi:hypothetical protein